MKPKGITKRTAASLIVFLGVAGIALLISANPAFPKTKDRKATPQAQAPYATSSRSGSYPTSRIRLVHTRLLTEKHGHPSQGPAWSPDGKWLAIGGMNTIAIVRADGTGSPKVLDLGERGDAYGMAWSLDGREMWYRENVAPDERFTEWVVRSVNLNTGEIQNRPGAEWREIQSAASARKGTDPVVSTNFNLNTQTQTIEARTADGRKRWGVTPKPGEYLGPVLSPDKKKVAVDEGVNMSVYAADGSGLLTSLGDGMISKGSWSPDSTQLMYDISEFAGGSDSITKSELFVINVDGSGKQQLTDTPDIHEMWPAWSPDGSRIAYIALDHGIFLADIERY